MSTNDGLRDQALNGISWSLADKAVSQGVGFVINILLARLLLPKDFGLLGMVVVVIGFAAIFQNFGLGSAIVQKKDLTNEDLNSVFWFNLMMGVGLTALIYFSAPLIAAYYGIPGLQPIGELLSLTYFISALNVVQISLLRRKMDFRRIFIVNASATLISGGIAVFLALTGWGVWSLVWKMLIFSIVTNIVLWVSSNWRPALSWSKDSLSQIMKFSLPLLGTQSLNYWVRNADNLLIGKYLGDNALGFYNQSYRIMLIPVSQISGVVSSVLFPSLAQIHDDRKRIKAIYLKVTKILSFITFPMMFGLCALAEPFVLNVLGTKWMPMVFVLQCLSVVGAFQSLGTLSGNVFMALDKTSYQFKVGLFPKFLQIGGILTGLSYGINGVAFCYMCSVLLSSTYMYFFMGRLIDMSLHEVYGNFGFSLCLSIVMAATVYGLYFFLGNPNSLAALLSMSLFGVAIYFTAYYLMRKNFLVEIYAVIGKAINK